MQSARAGQASTLTVSLSREQRTHADDPGAFSAPLTPAAIRAGAATPLGALSLSLQDCRELPGYWEARLSVEPQALEQDWRWLRLRGWQLPSGSVAALANGLNGWSESPLLTVSGVLAAETNPLQRPFGDDELYVYAERPGVFHAWSVSYLQVQKHSAAGAVADWGNELLAACSEHLFNNLFEFDLTAGTVALVLDIAGARLPEDGLLAVWLLPKDEPERAFKPLSELMAVWSAKVAAARYPLPHSAQPGRLGTAELPVYGYTSWYYRYRDIDPEWLQANLAALSVKPNWRIFQVDDGYQTAVGDWEHFVPAFPHGLSPFFRQVRAAGKTPGIWCAPFVALESSVLVAEHPDWLLRGEGGERVLCGDFAHWGGKFYALDTEHPEVLAHLTRTLQTMFVTWGAGFLKADFLYAAAKVPAGGLSRAQRGERAHRFLQAVCAQANVRLLSCGATVASSYHHCDFARVGPDVQAAWEDLASARFRSREKVSTRAGMVNALTRYAYDGAGFRNDPDVFFLRDADNALSADERRLVATVNGVFGNLIFCSDLLSEYDLATLSLLRQIETMRRRLGVHPVQRIGLAKTDDEAGQLAYLIETTAAVCRLELAPKPHLDLALRQP